MIELDYETLGAAQISTAPFPHIVVPHFVPPVILDKVISDFPKIDRGGSYLPRSLRLKPIIQALVDEMTGDLLRAVLSTRFQLDLSNTPTMLTLRGRTRSKDGRIHCDSFDKKFTALVYLNRDGEQWKQHVGCL